MSRLVTVDPGLRSCGVAVFYDGKLVAAGLPRNSERTGRGLVVWQWMARSVVEWLAAHGVRGHGHELVIECPQVYTAGKSKGDPNDLIELAGVVGRVAGSLAPYTARSLLPREWKGTLDADDMTERIRGRLSPAELAAIDGTVPASLLHNVLDAVGIGLHVLGRLAPRKVYPR